MSALAGFNTFNKLPATLQAAMVRGIVHPGFHRVQPRALFLRPFRPMRGLVHREYMKNNMCIKRWAKTGCKEESANAG